MLIRALRDEEKSAFDQVVNHPLQSWDWGEFRKETHVQVERLGFFEDGKLVKGLQATFHPIPLIGKTAGYVPKGFQPDEDQLAALKELGKQHNALFIKLEPNVAVPASESEPSAHQPLRQFLLDHGCEAGKPLFTKYTFQLDLTPDEKTLFANLASKTRYNVRLAKKKGVEIYEDSTQKGLEVYLAILKETTSRQGFYAHTPAYFQKMWDTLQDSGMMHIFHAVYQQQVLVSWIVFTFGDTLYYPYGASRREFREVMASNLMMWEMIRFGQKNHLKKFDMWGSLGPKPDPKSSWYGFHRFKEGYGGQLMEFVGSYDLVLNHPLYSIFRKADNWRWKVLRLKQKIGL